MRKATVTDVLLPALCLCLTLGVAFVFGPCAAREDGTWMNCHHAGQAVLYVGLAACLLNVLRFFLSVRLRQAIDLLTLALAVLAALLPGTLIHLCVMASMRCRSVMQPAVLVLSVLIAAAALIDLPLQRRRERKA